MASIGNMAVRQVSKQRQLSKDFLPVTHNIAPLNSRFSDRAYNYVVKKIFCGEWEKGIQITEASVAEEYRSVMGPYVMPFSRLHYEGWIVRLPNRYTYINNFQEETKFHEICLARRVIEVGVFDYLARCITQQQLDKFDSIVSEIESAMDANSWLGYREADAMFHRQAVLFGGGKRTLDYFEPLLLQSFSLGPALPGEKIIGVMDPVDRRLPHASHRAVYNALEAHNPAQTVRLINEHIGFTEDYFFSGSDSDVGKVDRD